MGIRAFDATLAATVLITPIFLGSIFLLVDIPIFNPVSSFSIVIAVLGLISRIGLRIICWKMVY